MRAVLGSRWWMVWLVCLVAVLSACSTAEVVKPAQVNVPVFKLNSVSILWVENVKWITYESTSKLYARGDPEFYKASNQRFAKSLIDVSNQLPTALRKEFTEHKVSRGEEVEVELIPTRVYSYLEAYAYLEVMVRLRKKGDPNILWTITVKADRLGDDAKQSAGYCAELIMKELVKAGWVAAK